MTDAALIQSLFTEIRALHAKVDRLLAAHPEPAADPSEDLSAELLDRCRAGGRRVSPDGFVSAETAGLLLNRDPGTLKRWRREFPDRLEFRRLGNRPEYSLQGIAEYLAVNQPDDY